MAKIVIPEGLAGKDLFRFLVSNKKALIAEKKFEMKFSDPLFQAHKLSVKTGGANKASAMPEDTPELIYRLCVINTTNWMDSHSDVHIPGLWKKSLTETKDLYLLQEHMMKFQGIITDQVQAYTKQMAWQQLGLDAEGVTEALIFQCAISNKRNPYMFDQYSEDYVKNHSVGMQYVDLQLAVNEPEDDYYKEEFAVWNKYIGSIANANDAEEQGYFWAVREAKVIEGSAVPIGSNRITPTLNSSTGKEPLTGTWIQPQENGFDIGEAIKSTKFFNN